MTGNIFRKKRKIDPDKARAIGARAKADGTAFENYFFHACHRAGIYAIQFPMGCKRVPGYGKPRLIQVKTPFDFILCKDVNTLPVSSFVDTKSCGESRFVYSALVPHQVQVMADLCRLGFKAGYVVYFKPLKTVHFFSASKLELMRSRESIGPEDGEYLGTILEMNLKDFL